MGCGPRPIEGFINADVRRFPGVEVLCDFSRFPWPFVDDSFEEVQAINIIEHLDNTIRVMEEVHRITKRGARIIIKVPHYKHANAFKDPTHVRFFMEETFDYFGKNEYSYYTNARFRLVSVTKIHEYHVAKYVKRLFPRLLPWIEKFLDNTVESLIFTLETDK
jgi:predicted SAM-dependent methyltransferase